MGVAEASPALRPAWYGYVVLAAGFVIHLNLGAVYCWGNLTAYVTSYMRVHNSSLTYADTLLAYTLVPVGQAVMILLGGYMQWYMGERLTCFIGCFLLTLSWMLSHFTVQVNLPAFLSTFSILFGIGMGMAYTCPIAAAIKYLPHRKGAINGIVVTGLGLSAFALNFAITGYVNPHNCKPVCPGDDDSYAGFTCPGWNSTAPHALTSTKCDKYFPPHSPVSENVPNLFLLLGAISLCTALPACFLVCPPDTPIIPWRRRKTEEGDNEPTEGGPPLPPPAAQDLTTREVLRKAEGWQLCVGFALTSMGGAFIMAQYKVFGQNRSWSNDHYEQEISSIMSVGNALGRLVQGLLADHLGFLPTLLGMASLQTVMLFAFTFTGFSKGLFTTTCILIAFLYGGNFALYPTGCVECFGRKHFPTNYGFVFSGFGISGVVVGALNKGLIDRIGFSGMTFINGSLCAIGAANALALLLRHRRRAKSQDRDLLLNPHSSDP
eukprot:Sspe_Gene.88288::Locus_60334_Transcript_3_4_Confidence_0.333_Length_1759::g.88288::m.88288